MSEIIMQILQNVMLLLGFVGGGNAFPKPLSPKEEQHWLKLWAEGDENAKNVLIEHNLRLVAHIAKKYAADNNFDDLVSTGTIGLIKGINTFDMTKTSKLTTYIARCIENEVLMMLRLSKKTAGDISLEECIGTDKEGNNMTFSDILPADTEDISDMIALKINIKKLYSAMGEVLTPDEKNILCWRYGLGNKKRKTQKEISQILGISRSYVSRIEKRAIKKLSEKIEE
ncbi:MAG: RNA polymerase sporulation sigma factor SigK [Clostridia bacterium]|nr:RNA polymerase sporulation sigma factor SigK [Clostridia bacterium]MBP3360217.1 RNA polymerase sporulation sigma factor SigK [Clostridia bacterium]